jgi:heat shock protein HslJ
MRTHPVARVAVVVILVAACSGSSPTSAPPTSASTPAPTRIPGLEATLWKLVSVNGSAVPAAGQAAAGLEIGSPGVAEDVRGSGPCGELSGSYTVGAPGTITFTVASTKVNDACDAASLKLRQDYLDDLAAAKTWTVDGTKLTVSGKGDIVFENQANHL